MRADQKPLVGRVCFHNRNEEIQVAVPLFFFFGSLGYFQIVHTVSNEVAHSPKPFDMGLHPHEFAAHIGVIDDGDRSGAFSRQDAGALNALFGVSDGMLV